MMAGLALLLLHDFPEPGEISPVAVFKSLGHVKTPMSCMPPASIRVPGSVPGAAEVTLVGAAASAEPFGDLARG
jgi:hypothetical protein